MVCLQTQDDESIEVSEQAAGLTDRERVRALTATPEIIEFCDFVVHQRGDNPMPRFDMDSLMRVPRLVPHMFVFDFLRGIEDGLYMRFSGTKVDLEYNRNMTGRRVDDSYPGDDDKDGVLSGYRRVYTDGLRYYTRRTIHLKGGPWQNHRVAESLMFPCSENGTDIDYGLGVVLFDFADDTVKPVFTHW